MQISRETEYAVRCVTYLAREPERTAMIDDIARDMEIPRSFLAKILQKLARASLVVSFRGAKGGFRLAKPPEEISLYELFLQTEGPAAARDTCAVSKKRCGAGGYCAIHPVWDNARKDLIEMLRKECISDLGRTLRFPMPRLYRAAE